ncbi:hypothetical protein SIPHO067v1_p0010 [Vibrio phage 51E28.1]|nr:hypothetical protein SIPHO068v1_p0091 [Vibrio phage 51E28.4]QZI92850.1 hypothetical protein SIPHO067v1_p0010 [Vibrio phage 51E28.1]
MITITLNQIKAHKPCTDGWKKLLQANGGMMADMDKPFPMSSILESNNFDDTIWVMRCLPEYTEVWRKFACFCALQNVELIKLYCSEAKFKVVIDYLNNPSDDARAIARAIAREASGAACANYSADASEAADAVAAATYSDVVEAVAAAAADAVVAVYADAAAAREAIAASAAVVGDDAAAAHAVETGEIRQKQADYLKELLDNYEYFGLRPKEPMMNPLEFNAKAAELIQSLANSLQELHDCGDVGDSVINEVDLLNDFQATYKKPQQPEMFSGVIRKMLEEKDRYHCIAISTAALTEYDQQLLAQLEISSSQVMGREYGWFIKMGEEPNDIIGELDADYCNLKKLLDAAHKAGYRMVEFDSDAQLYSQGFDEDK